MPGSIVVEANESILDDAFTLLGITTEEKDIVLNDREGVHRRGDPRMARAL